MALPTISALKTQKKSAAATRVFSQNHKFESPRTEAIPHSSSKQWDRGAYSRRISHCAQKDFSFSCSYCTGQCTHCREKYTSASPLCTCLPSRQICIGVALSDPPQTPLQCWLVGRTSTPRLRLCVLASQLVNIALKLHSVDHRWLNCNVDS